MGKNLPTTVTRHSLMLLAFLLELPHLLCERRQLILVLGIPSLYVRGCGLSGLGCCF